MAKRKEIKYIVNESGCHICTSHSKNNDGYPICGWKHRVQRLHRAIYEEAFGKLDSKVVVRHTCNNRACINIDHLIIGTQYDNVMDSVRAGTHKHPVLKEENNPTAKLNRALVLEIHKLKHQQNLSETKIANRLNNIVDRATIGHVLRGETWKSVYDEYHKK